MTLLAQLHTNVQTDIPEIQKAILPVAQFDILVTKNAAYGELQNDIRELKIKRGRLQTTYGRLPTVFALKEMDKRIRHYGEQQSALNRGEIPTKMLNRTPDERDALSKAYRDANQKCIEMLEFQRIELQAKVDNDIAANDLEVDILSVELAIKQKRAARNEIKRQLKRFVNTGKTGMLYESDDKRLVFTSMITNESSSS